MSQFQYPKLKVDSPNVKYSVDQNGHEQLESLYEYDHVRVEHDKTARSIKVSPARPSSASGQVYQSRV